MSELDLNSLESVSGGATKQSYVGPCFEYVVVKGDTLGKIAKRYSTTVPILMSLNPIIKDKNLIKIGWKLLVPLKK